MCTKYSKNLVCLISFILVSKLFALPYQAEDKRNFITTDQDIIAIGDIHGDLDNVQALLRRIKIIDDQNHWMIENTILVQLGDQIDRGHQDRLVIDFFQNLKKEALLHNSEVFEILGNHETYNAVLDFKSIAASDEFLSFYQLPFILPKRCMNFYENKAKDFFNLDYYRQLSTDGDPVPLGVRGRAQAFCPGGEYARLMASKYISLIINRTLFVHAEITKKYSALKREGLQQINLETANWLKDPTYTSTFYSDIDQELFRDKEGPLRSRFFSRDFTEEKCSVLDEVLKDLEVDRMVVGHSVQPFGITSDCNGKIFRIDTGYSQGFDYNRIRAPKEALKISADNNTHILTDKDWKSFLHQNLEVINHSTLDCTTDPTPANTSLSKCPRDLAHMAFEDILSLDYFKDHEAFRFSNMFLNEEDMNSLSFNPNTCYFKIVDRIIVLEGLVKCNHLR